MKNNYCLPIIKESESEVLAEIKANEANYCFFEIWLDYVRDLRSEFLITLLNEYKGRLVFVFRRKNLDKTKLSLLEQIEITEIFQNKDCLVDMDIYNQADLIRSTLSNKLKTIISFHDYEQTPKEEELYKIIENIRACKPEIFKISTFCKNKSDALLLLKIMLELNATKEKHIILGMGENGIITRLYGAIWGNEITFIPEKKEQASAPGQLTRLEFEELLKGMKIGGK